MAHQNDPILKVQIVDGLVKKLKYEHNAVTYTMEDRCPVPHADFLEAFGALGDLGLNILELQKHANNPVTVTTLTINHKKGKRNFILSFKRGLVNSPQSHTLNTPLKWDAHKDPNQALNDDELAIINTVESEARLYLDGKCTALEQGDLFEADAESRDQVYAATEMLVKRFGEVPELTDVKAWLVWLKTNLELLRGWIANGAYGKDVLVPVANTLEQAFNKWRNEGPVVSGEKGKKAVDLGEAIAHTADRVRNLSMEETPFADVSGDGQADEAVLAETDAEPAEAE